MSLHCSLSSIMFCTTDLDLCNVKESLRMITRINLLYKSYLTCSDFNERYDIGQASFTSVFELFAIQVIWWVSGFSYRIFCIFESLQLREFSTDLQDLSL